MNMPDFLRIGVFLTGLVILGEALALLVGMHFLSEQGNPWISLKNDLLLGVDIATGAGLIYLSFAITRAGINRFSLLYFIAALALLAHGYRAWEYLTKAANRFCINLPLYAVNNIKLAALTAIILSAIVLEFTNL